MTKKKNKVKEHISLGVDEVTDEYVVHISQDFRIQEAVILFAKLARHQGKTYKGCYCI